MTMYNFCRVGNALFQNRRPSLICCDIRYSCNQVLNAVENERTTSKSVVNHSQEDKNVKFKRCSQSEPTFCQSVRQHLADPSLFLSTLNAMNILRFKHCEDCSTYEEANIQLLLDTPNFIIADRPVETSDYKKEVICSKFNSSDRQNQHTFFSSKYSRSFSHGAENKEKSKSHQSRHNKCKSDSQSYVINIFLNDQQMVADQDAINIHVKGLDLNFDNICMQKLLRNIEKNCPKIDQILQGSENKQGCKPKLTEKLEKLWSEVFEDSKADNVLKSTNVKDKVKMKSENVPEVREIVGGIKTVKLDKNQINIFAKKDLDEENVKDEMNEHERANAIASAVVDSLTENENKSVDLLRNVNSIAQSTEEIAASTLVDETIKENILIDNTNKKIEETKRKDLLKDENEKELPSVSTITDEAENERTIARNVKKIEAEGLEIDMENENKKENHIFQAKKSKKDEESELKPIRVNEEINEKVFRERTKKEMEELEEAENVSEQIVAPVQVDEITKGRNDDKSVDGKDDSKETGIVNSVIVPEIKEEKQGLDKTVRLQEEKVDEIKTETKKVPVSMFKVNALDTQDKMNPEPSWSQLNKAALEKFLVQEQINRRNHRKNVKKTENNVLNVKKIENNVLNIKKTENKVLNVKKMENKALNVKKTENNVLNVKKTSINSMASIDDRKKKIIESSKMKTTPEVKKVANIIKSVLGTNDMKKIENIKSIFRSVGVNKTENTKPVLKKKTHERLQMLNQKTQDQIETVIKLASTPPPQTTIKRIIRFCKGLFKEEKIVEETPIITKQEDYIDRRMRPKKLCIPEENVFSMQYRSFIPPPVSSATAITEVQPKTTQASERLQSKVSTPEVIENQKVFQQKCGVRERILPFSDENPFNKSQWKRYSTNCAVYGGIKSTTECSISQLGRGQGRLYGTKDDCHKDDKCCAKAKSGGDCSKKKEDPCDKIEAEYRKNESKSCKSMERPCKPAPSGGCKEEKDCEENKCESPEDIEKIKKGIFGCTSKCLVNRDPDEPAEPDPIEEPCGVENECDARYETVVEPDIPKFDIMDKIGHLADNDPCDEVEDYYGDNGYKNLEYYKYNPSSFYDIQRHLAGYRNPQPSPYTDERVLKKKQEPKKKKKKRKIKKDPCTCK